MNSPATALSFNLKHLSEAEFAAEVDQLRIQRMLSLSALGKKKAKAPKVPKAPKEAKTPKAKRSKAPAVTLEELTALGLTVSEEQLATLTAPRKRGRKPKAAEGIA